MLAVRYSNQRPNTDHSQCMPHVIKALSTWVQRKTWAWPNTNISPLYIEAGDYPEHAPLPPDGWLKSGESGHRGRVTMGGLSCFGISRGLGIASHQTWHPKQLQPRWRRKLGQKTSRCVGYASACVWKRWSAIMLMHCIQQLPCNQSGPYVFHIHSATSVFQHKRRNTSTQD